MPLCCQFKYGLLIFLSLLQGFSTESCYFKAEMKQVLLNDGFHRNLTYELYFNNDDIEETWLFKDCMVAVDQMLPPGVYADPDQISELLRMDKVTARVQNRINSELPTEQSYPSNVLVVENVIDDMAALWVPLHARYHLARAGGGKVQNEIDAPKVYLHCPEKRLEMCNLDLPPASTTLCNGITKRPCAWKEIPYILLTNAIIWETPVGNTNHYILVGSGTAIVVLLGSLYLLNVIHVYTVNVKWKKM